MKERSRVSAKTSLTRLSIDEAVKALGIEVDVLRKRIQENSILHERDGHGRVYVLVGAYSNLSHADYSRQRKPQDEAMIQALESYAANLSTSPVPSEELEAPPAEPEEPEEPF